MPSEEQKRAIELVAGGIAVALLFAYSALVIGRPLTAIGLVIPLVVLYRRSRASALGSYGNQRFP